MHLEFNRGAGERWSVLDFFDVEEGQGSLAVLLHDLEAARGLLEHGEAGVDAILHAAEIEAGGELEGLVLHHLREGVAGGEDVLSLHWFEAEEAGVFGEAPAGV